MDFAVGDKVVFKQPTINLQTGEWSEQEIEAEIAEVSRHTPRCYRVKTVDDPRPSLLWFGIEQLKRKSNAKD
jgi:hypothetical protein